MSHATIAVTLPEGLWISDVSRAFSEARFRVLAAMPGEETGYGIVQITHDDPRAVVEAMLDHPGLVEVTPLHGTENRGTVQFETTTPLLLLSAQASGLPIELPITIRDGEAAIEVTGSSAHLSELCTQLEGFGLEFRVESVSSVVDSTQLLSPRQRELVVEAVERGYYDTPRSCTLTELADAVGIAKSTCSETLHRAEETIVKEFVSDLPEGIDPERPLPG
jgi:hypothetical protein